MKRDQIEPHQRKDHNVQEKGIIISHFSSLRVMKGADLSFGV